MNLGSGCYRSVLSGSAVVLCMCVAGCVSRRSAETFGRIRADVAARSGQRIEWQRQQRDSQTASSRTDALLAGGLTLAEALEVAILNNPRLQATYEAVDVAEARVVQAILPPNPGVEALFKHVRHGGHIWELTAVQEVVDLIMIPWRKKAAESEVERVRAMVTAEVLDVLLNVKVAYRRAQAALQHLSMLEQTLASDEAAYAMAHRLRDAGNISKLALRGRKAVLEQTRLVVTNARLRVAETREALTLALGLDGERTAWSVAEELPAMPEDRLDARDVSEAALSNSLDLARARAILTRTAREEGITNVTSLLPELHIGVESEREPDGTWIVGPLVEAPLPLFDWGQAERAIADARVRRAAAEYRMVAVALSSAVRLTMRRLELTRKQAEQYRDVNVPLQESLTQETHLHFNAMQLGVFQLLAAKKEELAMRRRYIDSLRDYWIARAEAEQLMSGRMVAQSAAAASEGMAVGSAGNDGGH